MKLALPTGLCDLISKEIIELGFAIDLFNTEQDIQDDLGVADNCTLPERQLRPMN